jgi:hypothetical protein
MQRGKIQIIRMKEKYDAMKKKKDEKIKRLKEKKIASQPSLKSLRDTAWRLFSKVVREEEQYICYTCGKDMKSNKPNCHAGHYVPRGRVSALRFDRRNVHAQCSSCNMYMSGNLSIYAVKLEKQYGMGILQEFEEIRLSEDKISGDGSKTKVLGRLVLMEMIEQYRKRLAELQGKDAHEDNKQI